jgi:hypothetical protein
MKTVLAALALSAAVSSRAVGQDSERSRQTLAGLKGVYVLVEPIRAQVEAVLKQKGRIKANPNLP